MTRDYDPLRGVGCALAILSALVVLALLGGVTWVALGGRL